MNGWCAMCESASCDHALDARAALVRVRSSLVASAALAGVGAVAAPGWVELVALVVLVFNAGALCALRAVVGRP